MWLQTCASNAERFDFLVYTDDTTAYDYPKNVKVRHLSFEALKEKIQACYDFSLSLERPYRLCCFKPAYGEIFKDDIIGYSHWAYGDCDLLWGNLQKMMPEDWQSYDRIGVFGHLSIIRNTERMRHIYRYAGAYKTAFSIDAPLFFDEDAYNLILEKNGCKMYALKIADLTPRLKNFHIVSRYKQGDRSTSVFTWKDGSLMGYSQQAGQWVDDEYAYVHFLKRPMAVKANADGRALLIVPNEVRAYQGEDLRQRLKHGSRPGLFWAYWKNSFRPHNFVERLCNRLYRNRRYEAMKNEMKKLIQGE